MGVFRVGGGFPQDQVLGGIGNNCWVDVLWWAPTEDITEPTSLAVTPHEGSTSVRLDEHATIRYDEEVDPAGLSITATAPDGTPVQGAVTCEADRVSARCAPTGRHVAGTTYEVTALVNGPAGNPAPTRTWSFTTGLPRPATCPCTLWDDFSRPADTDWSDVIYRPGSPASGHVFK
ncbi:MULTISPECIES: Ig-like domain-containing protein [Actinosynnema]|uniref:Ig-like domain-containing protein n=1 Tax=Actinosynnema TaxID=40566 RepID=UPI0020A4667F|nr:Ig-like domain-containing protein [Actinosynnema pretiosum]MCP2099433.1 Ig-like domain-containing protein [Actinosynnema pretiosum]